ncbi:MAG TPA: glycosyltransferase [Terriglobales bacterium]|nr:glycosyltransferase [Terriglobales bacterium]
MLNRMEKAPAFKILQVVTRLGVGGAEHGMLNIMAGLQNDGIEQQICTMRGVEPGLMWTDRVKAEVLVAAESASRLRLDVARLVRIFREVRPAIVHSRNWGCLEAVVAARIAGVPVAIHSEHGYELDMLEGMPMRRRLFRAAAFRMAQAVFAVTKDLRDFHAKQAFCPAKRIGVIYNGVNVDKFKPMPDARRDARQELGISSTTCVFGTIGRLVPIKDQQTLLISVANLAGQGMDVAAMIVGDGPLQQELRAIAERHPALQGRAHFTGARTDTPRLLNAMDAFVLPSISEGMSNTLLEALATGLPLVATKVGGNPEVLGNDKCGSVFAPRDIGALSQILAELAGNAERRGVMGGNSRRRAVSTFSLEKMVSSYRDLYWGLAKKHNVLRHSEVSRVRN